MLFSLGSEDSALTEKDLSNLLEESLRFWGESKRILILPPDFTRIHSGAGKLTEMAWDLCGTRIKKIMPALGTHFPMTKEQIQKMFGSVPESLIVDHDWQNNLVELGRLDGDFMRELSGGKLDFDWPVEVNRILVEEPWDLILSIGQVVPHEIVGMANYTKNILVGISGKEAIDKSHFLGAVCGMEGIMGQTNSPVRRLFNTGAETFCGSLPILYVLTVVSTDHLGAPVIRGVFIGDDDECYQKAADLARKVNIHLLDKAPSKIVAYLDPGEFRSTWLGNKSIYRTRMAIADGGELVVLAPGIHCYGENALMDRLIRKYGYKGTDAVLEDVRNQKELQDNLSVAAHLIHGSSEGRFRITYCPGGLSREETEQAGFTYGDLSVYSRRYDVSRLSEGWNTMEDGEEIYYISNPALGLWAEASRFREQP